MSDLDRDGGAREGLRTVLGIVAVAVAIIVAMASLAFGVTELRPKATGAHITACGFDAQGAYAKVRVNNLLRSSARTRHVFVDFSTKASHNPHAFTFGASTTVDVTAPAHGHGTGVVQVLRSDFRIRVPSTRFARKHPTLVRTATVPDDPSLLRCSIAEVTEYRN